MMKCNRFFKVSTLSPWKFYIVYQSLIPKDIIFKLVLCIQLKICIARHLPHASMCTCHKQLQLPSGRYLLHFPNPQPSPPSIHPISMNISQMACWYVYYHKCILLSLKTDPLQELLPLNRIFSPIHTHPPPTHTCS